MRTRKAQLNNKGAAMILTITIIAVLIVFVFSLILVSYNLYASQNKNISSARNAEAVNTLSMAIKDELTSENASTNSNLWKYLRANVAYTPASGAQLDSFDWEDWPYYDENDTTGMHGEDKAFRYFELEKNPHIEGMPAEVTMCMYWTLREPKDGETDSPKKILFDNLNSGGSPKGIRLHVVIKAVTASQIYESEDIYRLSVKNTSTQEEMVNLLSKVFNNNNVDVANHYDGLDIANPNDDLKEKWTWKYVGRN